MLQAETWPGGPDHVAVLPGQRDAGLASRSSPVVRNAGLACMLLVMSWFAWLGLAVLITAVAAITGLKPKGTRHVAHTSLMGVARFVLLALVLILAYLAFRAYSGGR
jgi:hypothetical protein